MQYSAQKLDLFKEVHGNKTQKSIPYEKDKNTELPKEQLAAHRKLTK